MTRLLRALLPLLLALAAAGPAEAAGCFPVARRELVPRLVPAAYAPPRATAHEAAGAPRLAAQPEAGTLRLTFLGHSSFLIETPGGASAVTDYNGVYRPPYTPTIVTMNNAHSTHYTDFPDPGIAHVLRGWNPAGGWAAHDVEEADLRVRNIPTAVHGRFGDQELSNSLFVFETPDLCVAHLGHLHHLLTEEQVAELGQIDVLLVPIDGFYTMAQELMLEVMEQVRPALVVPMHYFGPTVLGRFTALADERWEVVESPSPTVTLSRADLPHRRVLVLPGS